MSLLAQDLAAARQQQVAAGLAAAQDLTAANTELQGRVRDQARAAAALTARLQALETDHARLAALAGDADEARRREEVARQEADQARADLAAAQAAGKASVPVRDEVGAVAREKELADANAALTSKLDALEAGSTRLAGVEAQLETAKGEAQAARSEADRMREELAAAGKRVGALEQGNARLSAQLQEAEARARAARRDADQAQADLLAVQARLAAGERSGGTPAVAPPPAPAAAPISPAAPPAARIYLVQEGDSLTRISFKAYGTRARWRELYEANRDVLADENSLRPGQQLRLPP